MSRSSIGSAVLFGGGSAALLLANAGALTAPPYWDAIVGLFNQAIWLEQHDFDWVGLWNSPGYAQGGPRIRPLNGVAVLIAGLYSVLSPPQVFFVLHLLTIAAAAGTAVLFFRILSGFIPARHAALWCLAAALNPVFSGQTAALYLEVPLALANAVVVFLIVKRRYGLATLWGIPCIFIKASFALTSLAIFTWLIVLALIQERQLFVGPHRRRQLALLLLPLIHLPLLAFALPKGDVMQLRGLAEIFAYAKLMMPDQMLLLGLTLVCSGALAIQLLRRRPPLPAPSERSLFVLLALIVWGFWASFWISMNPLVRYSAAYIFPLMALCGLSTLRLFGSRASLILASIVVLFGVANQHGGMLPELKGPRARSGDYLERSREYLIDQQAMADLCRALETQYAGRSIVAKYPLVQMLSMPELGYVSAPLPDVRAAGLTPSYAPVSPFISRARVRRDAVFIYSPTSFEQAWPPSLAPGPTARVLLRDESLPGTVLVYSQVD